MAESGISKGEVLKVLGVVVGLALAATATIWQDMRQDVTLLHGEVQAVDKRMSTVEAYVHHRTQADAESKEQLRLLSRQVDRIEKGLIRKRIIEP
jgi:hypothetical protein